MKTSAPPSLSPVPAARGAQQMAGTLDLLEGQTAEIFSGMPRLLALLMQFFAMLREALARRVEIAVPEPVQIALSPRRDSKKPSGSRVAGSHAGVRKLVVCVEPPMRPMAPRKRFDIVRSSAGGAARMEAENPNFFQKIAQPNALTHVRFVTISKQSWILAHQTHG